MTQNKHLQNLNTPKIVHLSKKQKNIEIQNFEPQKWSMKLSEYPSLPFPGGRAPLSTQKFKFRQKLFGWRMRCLPFTHIPL